MLCTIFYGVWKSRSFPHSDLVAEKRAGFSKPVENRAQQGFSNIYLPLAGLENCQFYALWNGVITAYALLHRSEINTKYELSRCCRFRGRAKLWTFNSPVWLTLLHIRKYGPALCKVTWFSEHFNCNRLKCSVHHATFQEVSSTVPRATLKYRKKCRGLGPIFSD